MRPLRPVDLARAAQISTQQVRRYEAAGVIPTSVRTASGYRVYTEEHLAALLVTRAVVAGFGWQPGTRALRHLNLGDPDRAFAVADRVHLELHEARRRILQTITTLRTATLSERAPRPRRALRIGEAAAVAGVEVSALRHWERENLLTPRRDPLNGYRLYSADQVQRVQLIALLRGGGYPLGLIRSVVEELASGDIDAAVRAAEQRLAEINDASKRCAAATAALWNHYLRTHSSREPAANDEPETADSAHATTS